MIVAEVSSARPSTLNTAFLLAKEVTVTEPEETVFVVNAASALSGTLVSSKTALKLNGNVCVFSLSESEIVIEPEEPL